MREAACYRNGWTSPERQSGLLLVGLLFDDLEHALKTKKTLAKVMAQDLLSDDNSMGLIKLCGIRTICGSLSSHTAKA